MRSGAFLFLLILMMGSQFAGAQSLKIEAIELTPSGTNGRANIPSIQAFQNNARNPALFRGQVLSGYSEIREFRRNGFQINFLFSASESSKYKWLFGFGYDQLTSQLYEYESLVGDTLNINGTISGKNENFVLHAGFRRLTSNNSKLSLVLGSQASIGFPVSAKTIEAIEGSSSIDRSYSFFAKRSVIAGITVPAGVRFRMIRTVHLTLLIKPSLQFQTIDGSSMLAFYSGIDLGIRFEVRPG